MKTGSVSAAGFLRSGLGNGRHSSGERNGRRVYWHPQGLWNFETGCRGALAVCARANVVDVLSIESWYVADERAGQPGQRCELGTEGVEAAPAQRNERPQEERQTPMGA